jgi:hypothetical protein
MHNKVTANEQELVAGTSLDVDVDSLARLQAGQKSDVVWNPAPV